MAKISSSKPLATEQTSQGPIDRYESTFVVSPDPSKGDFTALQDAINALPATGGKIFVKAGLYPIKSKIQITVSNVQIQGEGMGITVFTGDSTMTGNAPGLEVYNPRGRDRSTAGGRYRPRRGHAQSLANRCFILQQRRLCPVVFG